MKRTNTFTIRPSTEDKKECLLRLLDASASLWNAINYERRQAFFGEGSVWDVDTGKIQGKYKDVLGSATVQQINRKNTSAWRSFFKLNEKWHNGEPEDKPYPPGYKGNKNDGRELHTLIRNDQYTIEWGKYSRLEIPIGEYLKEEYDITGRLRLEVRGNPNWSGEQGRLEIKYDEVDDVFRAFQPVTVDSPRQDQPLTDNEKSVALDIGVNNIVACTTSDGEQYLFDGKKEYREFREATEMIAEYQSKLPEERDSSRKIKRLYRKRTCRRNHMMDALIKQLIEKLHEDGISTIYVGDLTGILETHWQATVNEKTHNFWAYRRFIERLENKAEEYSMVVEEESEAWTSQKCPRCGETDTTTRHGETLTCTCGFEGHADLTASRNFLEEQEDIEVGLMAQPVRFEWDSHKWRSTIDAPLNPKEQRTNPQVASVESA